MTESATTSNLLDPHAGLVHVGEQNGQTGDDMLREQSQTNLASMTDSYLTEAVSKGQFPDEVTARGALDGRVGEMSGACRLTVNMSPSGVDHFLTTGRLESSWDVQRKKGTEPALGLLAMNGKDTSGNYWNERRAVEDGLRRFVSADAQKVEPIYAAVAGPREQMTGAAPSYGNCWLVLDNKVAERAVYTLSDSMASLEQSATGELGFDNSTVLSFDDMPTAKAIVELVEDYRRSQGQEIVAGGYVRGNDPSKIMTVSGRRPGYVEASIFDDVTTEQVTAIAARLETPDDIAGLGRLFSEHPELSGDNLQVYYESGISGMVVDWLGARVHTQTIQTESEHHESSTMWKQIGLAPDASFDEISTALSQRASIVLRDYAKYNPQFPKLSNYTDKVQWDGYIKRLQADIANGAQLKEFMELQQARVFFTKTHVA